MITAESLSIVLTFIKMLLLAAPSLSTAIHDVFAAFASQHGINPNLQQHLDTIDPDKHAAVDATVDEELKQLFSQ